MNDKEGDCGPNAGKQRSVTACQQFHKRRYVSVISPDILKTP